MGRRRNFLWDMVVNVGQGIDLTINIEKMKSRYKFGIKYVMIM